MQMLENGVKIFQMRAGFRNSGQASLSEIAAGDICFYRFIGGNPSETTEMVNDLLALKRTKTLLIGLFRFPFRFEGKRRLQTAIEQYYQMRDLSSAIVYFHSDGMMAMIDPKIPIQQANYIFHSYEDRVIQSLKNIIETPGEMNIDTKDIQTFILAQSGPIFFHSFEGETFDEPLKYAIATPYLADDFADGKRMIINIGCARDVDMDAYRQMNLRLHDLFHKADLFKLGTHFIDEPGHRFKITLLINGIQDPFPRPDHMKRFSWKKLFRVRPQKVGRHVDHVEKKQAYKGGLTNQ